MTASDLALPPRATGRGASGLVPVVQASVGEGAWANVGNADHVRGQLPEVDAVVCAADGVAPRREVRHLARRARCDAVLTGTLVGTPAALTRGCLRVTLVRVCSIRTVIPRAGRSGRARRRRRGGSHTEVQFEQARLSCTGCQQPVR